MKDKFNLFDDRKYIIYVACGILIVFIIMYGKTILSVIPYFKIKNVEIEGNRALSKRDVMSLLKVTDSDSIFLYDIEKARKRFIKTGIIKKIKIYPIYPSTLKVKIRERLPVAIVIINKNGKRINYLVDEEANIVSKRRNISGIKLPFIYIGDINNYNRDYIKTNLKKTLYSLSVISFNDKNGFKRIKKIKFVEGKTKVYIWIDNNRKKFIVKDFLKVKHFIEIKHLLNRSEVSDRGFNTFDLRFDDIIAR